MWLNQQDMGIDDIFTEDVIYTESWSPQYNNRKTVKHWFQEGNGRSQREFIRSLALKNGYLIYFDRVSEEEMLLASQKSFLCDYEDMEKIIAKCIKKK